MARGAPDYRVSSSLYGQTSTDVFELAARMGYVDTMDRRGSVVFIDDFSNLLTPYTMNASAVVNSNIVNKASMVFSGDHALRMSGVAVGGNVFSKYLPVIDENNWGFELSWGYEQAIGESMADVDFYIRYYDGVKSYFYAIEFNIAANNLTYYVENTPGVVTHPILLSDLGNIAVPDRVIYHYMKMVVDLSTKQYIRLIYDTKDFDLSGNYCYYNNSVAYPSLRSEVFHYAIANPADLYIGHWISTMNEP